MVADGVDDSRGTAGTYPQVVQVGVVVDQDGGDRFGLVLTCLGVGGEDLFALGQLADRDQRAGCGQDLGRGGEGLAANHARDPHVFCGECGCVACVGEGGCLDGAGERREDAGGGGEAGAQCGVGDAVGGAGDDRGGEV